MDLLADAGFGRGFGRGFAFNQTSSKTQKELLNEQKTMLQDRLEVIDKLIGEPIMGIRDNRRALWLFLIRMEVMNYGETDEVEKSLLFA